MDIPRRNKGFTLHLLCESTHPTAKQVRDGFLTKVGAGFTLLETVLAVLVVATVVAVMIDIFISSAKAGSKSSNLAIALSLAQARMEEINNLHTNGIILLEGSGSNGIGDFLPALTKVSVDAYPTNLYLTESNDYQSFGTPGSLSGMDPARRIDRITQIEWIDDPSGGSNQDYLKVTVTVFWNEGDKTTSVSLVKYVYQKP